MSTKNKSPSLASYTILPGGRFKLNHGFCIVETDIGPVTIHRDLPDSEGNGRDVVRIEIAHWPLGPRFEIRNSGCLRAIVLNDGETKLPATERAPGVKDPDCMSREELVAFAREVQRLAFGDCHEGEWSSSNELGADFVGYVRDTLVDHGLAPRST